jgi:hypothetical protein
MACEFGTVAAYANVFDNDFKKNTPEGLSPRASGTGFMGRVKDFFTRCWEKLPSIPGRVAACFRFRNNTSSTMPGPGAVTVGVNSRPANLVVQQIAETDLPVHQSKEPDFPGLESNFTTDLERILGVGVKWEDLD